MTKYWSPRAFFYLGLGIAGLVGTWTYNLSAIQQSRDFFRDLGNSGPAVSSLTVDLLVVAVAGSVFIIVEARRLGMRGGWLYVVLSIVTAFAFTFPVFLAARERTLRRIESERTERTERTGLLGGPPPAAGTSQASDR